MSVWAKKGLCGLDMRKQTYSIAFMYMVSEFVYKIKVVRNEH